ncbi:MAG: amidohydrolase [Ginsengibacter sp.]
MGYSASLRSADLFNTTSWDETLERLKIFSTGHPNGWLIGRGWDQNKWPGKQFPNNQRLNELFPDRPVVLTRVDGHAVIANKKALEIAGIVAGQTIAGGQIEIINGELTGILVDNAKGLINAKIPDASEEDIKGSVLKAQHNCFAFGLTTINDCGLDYPVVEWLMRLQSDRELKMRMYVMLSDSRRNYEYLFSKGKIKTSNMHVCSFKVYADGALGSRGASLLEPYSDKKDWMGFLLSSQVHFDSVAKAIYEHGFQMCTHAIGDSGNRTILKIYAKYLKNKNDLRWRVEHAQVINADDFHYFGDYSIVPSVQPTHATSDMYWAGDRLGIKRLKGAYAYRELLNENGWIPLGTDFPIEDISTFKTFYASVARKDSKGYPAGGFQMENALTREQTLKGMTIWAAKSNFEEKEKGSIEVGKVADFIILDRDIMKVDLNQILSTKVVMTFLNGEKVYEFK